MYRGGDLAGRDRGDRMGARHPLRGPYCERIDLRKAQRDRYRANKLPLP
jgi:hypothetical protein